MGLTTTFEFVQSKYLRISIGFSLVFYDYCQDNDGKKP
ncbi:hypothetical protein PTUN_a1152 [Pseudoalteromonas tunicata]|uniref:Glycine dehydrogenase n=1 Tax=Pseudoalteromonas tunicata D2 TaxID=87626 RepID=A4CCN0_9GAMM|nr:hypothetical protein PTUN_a1152 [Pseudoalteromonas tunicata]EAR27323.1 glycine dehydrogenase [Pseudoalteromonas tunicata D2]